MKVFQFVVALSLIAGLASAASLTGKVNYKGKPVKAEVVKMNADPVCAKDTAGKKVPKEDVIVNANGTLANVFVYVKEGVKGTVPPAPSEPVIFDQKGCQYTPHVFGIRVGQKLKILNSDATLHNVNAQAKVNAKFNEAMPTKGSQKEKTFTKPEALVKIKCDVHGWMHAYMGVVEHPYFAVTDSSGNFTIKDLPAGDYTLEAVHEKLGAQTQKVTVSDAGKPVEYTFQ